MGFLSNLFGGGSSKAAEAQANAAAESARMSAEATEKAALIQDKAAQESIKLQRDQFNKNIEMLMPYLTSGSEAYGRAQAMLFSGPPTVTYKDFKSYNPAPGKYTAPTQVNMGEFIASPATEDFSKRLAQAQANVDKYNIQTERAQSDANRSPTGNSHLDQIYNSNPAYYRTEVGQRELQNLARELKGSSGMGSNIYSNSVIYSPPTQAPVNAEVLAAQAELKRLQDEDAKRIAMERRSYDQSAQVTDAFNRGIGVEQGPRSVSYEQSPGYQFQMDEGLKAIQRNAAARGRLDSGDTLKALQSYGQGLASQDFQNYQNTVNRDYYNYLNALAGQSGQQAVNTANNMGSTYANNLSNILSGNAQNQAQATQSAANQRASGYLNQQTMLANASANKNAGLLDTVGSLIGSAKGGMFGGKIQGWFK
mgnify:CR=1 FL=1